MVNSIIIFYLIGNEEGIFSTRNRILKPEAGRDYEIRRLESNKSAEKTDYYGEYSLD
jgi:hypothetical protein